MKDPVRSLRVLAIALVVAAAPACNSSGPAAGTSTTSATLSASPGTVAAASRTPGTGAGFAYVDAPSPKDAGDKPLHCVLGGRAFDVKSLVIRQENDGFRKWSLEMSSQPLDPDGYLPSRADHVDLYLAEANPLPGVAVEHKTGAKAGQVIVRWNDLFGPHAAQDDSGRDMSANILPDGHAYAIVFDQFVAPARNAPGKASGRLYLGLKPTGSDAQKFAHFKEPCGCAGVFHEAVIKTSL
jgi:hypothetical protein